MRLFTPGPTNVPADVRAVLAKDVVHHRTPPFAKAYEQLIVNLKSMFRSSGEMLVLTSSGTGAMEAGIANLFSPKESVIVVSNGYFGERLVAIAKQYQLNVIEVTSPWGVAVDLSKVDEALAKNPQVVGLITAHCDTSTGVLNDIKGLGEIAHRANLIYMVDTISGLPYNEFDFEGYHIDLAVAASQKGFLLPPGLAFMSLSSKAVKRIESTTSPRYYFDLRKYLTSMRDHFQTPFTPNISLVFAGAYAVQQMVQKGVAKYGKHAQELRDYLHPQLLQLGFTPIVPSAHWSNGIVAYQVPSGMDSNDLRQYLMETHQIMIEGGLGPLRKTMIRIGFMSELTKRDADALLKGIQLFLKKGMRP